MTSKFFILLSGFPPGAMAVLFFSLAVHGISIAQYNAHSVYSMFGLGDISSPGPVWTEAMGRAGIALPSENHLNYLNPASLNAIDSNSFIFDLGLEGYYSSFETSNYKERSADMNFCQLAIGFPVTRWWKASAGILPLSNVGYLIDTELPVEGTGNTIETQFTGSGGINNYFLSSSISISRQFSAGLSVSYMMGSIARTEVNKLGSLGFSELNTVKTQYFRNVLFGFGLQYVQPFNDDRLILGIRFDPGQKLKTRTVMDILISGSDTLDSEVLGQEDFVMPVYLAGGAAYEFGTGLRFAIDYGFRKWAENGYSSGSAKLNDSFHYNLGCDYRPGQGTGHSIWKTVDYRAGIYFERTCLNLRSCSIRDMGLTVGTGIPVNRQRSAINIALGIGQLGTLNRGLVKETYVSLKIGFCQMDRWFVKRKFE